MTGFGKAEVLSEGKKYVVEIRSLNGKNADISLKQSILPKEREIPARQYIAKELVRGNIDLFITEETMEAGRAKQIDAAIFQDYFRQISELSAKTGLQPGNDVFSAILRMPDVISAESRKEISEETAAAIESAIYEAVRKLQEFRIREGAVLKEDLLRRVENILANLSTLEPFEQERIAGVRERISSRIAELVANPDYDRLEQEMIFYIEKLDVNEEKVRLRQHCRYFLDTMESEDCPGRKLGFIAQEMGREINTLGSKSNHAGMQKHVVMMKDELEKIKEQVLNVL